MFDKKGMILLESCLFFMLCMLLTALIFRCALALHQRDSMKRDWFHDEEIREIYES